MALHVEVKAETIEQARESGVCRKCGGDGAHAGTGGREPFVVAARLATNFIFCRCQARSPSLGSRLLVDGIRKSLRSPDSALWLHPERDGRLALAYRSGCSGVGFRGSAFGRRATPQERTANAPRRNGTRKTAAAKSARPNEVRQQSLDIRQANGTDENTTHVAQQKHAGHRKKQPASGPPPRPSPHTHHPWAITGEAIYLQPYCSTTAD